MYPIVLAQWMKEKRSPFILLLFIGLSVLAVTLFGLNTESKRQINVFVEKSVTAAEAAAWIERLNHSEAFEFIIHDEQKVRKWVQEGRSTLAVQLFTDNYRILSTIEDINVQLAEQHIQTLFQKELQLRAFAEQADDPEQFRQDIEHYLMQPPLKLHLTSPDGGEIVSHDMGLQLMFGFALFLSMFTIGFKINAINMEKTSGVWNRMILSPVRKTQMYLGHLVYSSVIGFIQVFIVYLIFLYVFKFNLGDHFGMLLLVTAMYIVAVVAMAMLFTGITRTPEQFNMVYPSLVPIIPLISGVYMPPGTLTNPILLFVAEFFPLTHAMEALMGIAMYDTGWSAIFMPLAKLLLVTVICMGVGINLVERGRN